jgi:hypothetical protein
MDEKEKEEFLKAALDQHGQVRVQVIHDLEFLDNARKTVKVLKERRELESLGRWVINKCLLGAHNFL